MGSETPEPTSDVCFEVGKLLIAEQGELSDSPRKLPGGRCGKGPAQLVLWRSYHLCAVRGTQALEESIAKAGNRDSVSPPECHRAQPCMLYNMQAGLGRHPGAP